MARVTALRERKGDRVAVEVDGAPWRALPAGVVVRCGLRVGLELERPLLRELARELRRARALEGGVRALRRRALSRAGLEQHLQRAGTPPGASRAAVEALERAGYVDDARLAAGRAEALAGRGSGDALIRFDLERRGIAAELVERALAALEPEPERAARIVAARGGGPRTARYLASRGFGADAVEAAVALDDAEA